MKIAALMPFMTALEMTQSFLLLVIASPGAMWEETFKGTSTRKQGSLGAPLKACYHTEFSQRLRCQISTILLVNYGYTLP